MSRNIYSIFDPIRAKAAKALGLSIIPADDFAKYGAKEELPDGRRAYFAVLADQGELEQLDEAFAEQLRKAKNAIRTYRYPKKKWSRNRAWADVRERSGRGGEEDNPFRKAHTADEWCWINIEAAALEKTGWGEYKPSPKHSRHIL